MKYLKYSGQIVIGIAVIVAILVFFGPCGNRKINQQYKQLQVENKLLQEKVKSDSITRANQRIAETAQIALARKETADAKADVKAADKKLTALQQRANDLAAVIRNTPVAADKPIDSNCVELAKQVPVLNAQVDQYRKESEETTELMNYEIILRDSIIEKEKEYSNELKADYGRQANALKIALQYGRPRGQFLIGAGVMGNQDKLLGGASVKAAYLTKGGKMYLYSPHLLQLPGMNKAGLFHEVGVLFNPFK